MGSNILDNLLQLTKDLLFFSESEYPFIVSEKNIGDVSSFEEYPFDVFFETVIERLLKTGDETMAEFAERYKTLYHYLKTIETVRIYKGPGIERELLIQVLPDSSRSYLLETTSVES